MLVVIVRILTALNCVAWLMHRTWEMSVEQFTALLAGARVRVSSPLCSRQRLLCADNGIDVTDAAFEDVLEKWSAFKAAKEADEFAFDGQTYTVSPARGGPAPRVTSPSVV